MLLCYRQVMQIPSTSIMAAKNRADYFSALDCDKTQARIPRKIYSYPVFGIHIVMQADALTTSPKLNSLFIIVYCYFPYFHFSTSYLIATVTNL
jgi:hypothetical protein